MYFYILVIMSNQENWSNNGKRVFHGLPVLVFCCSLYNPTVFSTGKKTSLWHSLEYLEGFQNFAASTSGWVSCWNHPWNVDFSVHRICHCHLARFRQCHDMTSLVHKELPGQTEPQKTIGFRGKSLVSVLWARHSQPIAASEAIYQWTEGENYRKPGSLLTIRGPQDTPGPKNFWDCLVVLAF